MADEENEVTFEVLETDDVNDERPELSDEDKDSIIKKLRDENAKRRIENTTLAEKAQKFEEYERSQMTELEKAQDEAKRLRERLEPLLFEKDLDKAVKETGLDPAFADLVKGENYEELVAHATDLAKRLGNSRSSFEEDDIDDIPEARTGDFFGGNEGKEPASGSGKSHGGNFLNDIWDTPRRNSTRI